MDTYLLAKNGREIDLVGPYFGNRDESPPRAGFAFERDKALHTGGFWTVIKVFEGKELELLAAMILLAGFDKIRPLFRVDAGETSWRAE